MRDLYRCLDEYSPPLLTAIADYWHVALPRGDTLEMVRSLGDGILAPGAVEAVVPALPPDALSALAEVAQEGGAVPAQRLVLRYGAIRRLGPARLLREQPWANPEGATEELYYRGLLYRAYGEVPGYLGDLLLIPDQLLQRIGPLAAPPLPWEQVLGAPPQSIRSAGRDAVEDMFAALAHLRRHPAPAASPDAAASPIVPAVEDLASRLRWRGERDPGRLTFLWRLMALRSLVSDRAGVIEPSPAVRDWLSLDDARRTASAFTAWRDDPEAHELRSLPTTRCEGIGGSADAARSRRNALRLLARFVPGQWYPLGALAMALKRHRPDYLRSEGEPGWFIRDVATDAYLDGPQAWDRVEGALAIALLAGPLYWLGMVDLGAPAEGAEAMAFRVSEHLSSLAESEGPAKPARRGAGRAVRSAGAPLATCDDGLAVRVSLIDSQYERYQLERLARWLRHDDQADVYQISEESIWEGHERGIRVPQVIAFLRRLCADRVPTPALRRLQEWGSHMGRATLTRTVVLRVADEATMVQIRSDRAATSMLGETLSPLACAVTAGRLEALIARLKVLRVWPHLRLEG